MNWMIPRSIREGDPAELEQATLVVKFATVICLNAGGFPIIMFLFGAYLVAWYNLIAAALIALCPAVMLFGASPRFASHTLIFLTMVLIQGVSILTGGVIGPSVPCLVVGPMAAVFLLGSRGMAWSAAAILCIGWLTFAEAMGLTIPTPLSDGEMLFTRCCGLIALVLFSLGFMLGFNSVKQHALSVVQAGNQRLTKMIVHVEAGSSALSRSAAELMGNKTSRSDKSQLGLTQQMMTTANSGRTMIEEFRTSLQGMIAQYQTISQRIRELHRQSGTIAALVKTIDNISDRLDLMALNTGIEAAHVGEAGKRFRLLADDMRRLAERVSAETRRIKAVIQQVQTHTDEAMESSTYGQELTDEGTQKLELMSHAFDEIFQLIESTAQVSERVTQDMNNHIHAIRSLASASLQVLDQADEPAQLVYAR